MRLKMFFLAAAMSLPLIGCGTLSGGTPQDHLNAARTAFTAAVVSFEAICAQANAPSACHDAKVLAAKDSAVTLANAGFAAAQASIDAGKPDAEAITQSAVEAVAAIGRLVAAMQATSS